MAIALDVASNATASGTSPLTWSHTCTGSDLLLVVGVTFRAGLSPNVSGVTYNDVSLTLIGSQRAPDSLSRVSLWYLLNPATGANTVSVSFTGTSSPSCDGTAVSYTGVAQSGQPDAVIGGTSSSANPSGTVTTIADNCWVVGVLMQTSGPATADLTERGTPDVGTYEGSYEDTNAPKTPAGGQAVSWTDATPGFWGIQAASFAPAVAAAAGTAGWKSLLGVGL